MDKVENKRLSGMNVKALKTWGMLFVLAGIVSRSVLQNRILGVGTVSGTELVQVMQASDSAMATATAALVLQVMETCAVPIFAFALVEGFQHTADWKKYLLRVAGLAVLSEIPYNLAMGQQVLDFGSRNPVFGLALGLVLLYLYQHFVDKKTACVIAALAALAWAFMLRIEHSAPLLLIVSALWIFRKNHMLRGFAGVIAAAVCTVGSLFYLAAPMGFLVIHAYNGEKGEENRVIGYLFYPVALLCIGLAAMFFI